MCFPPDSALGASLHMDGPLADCKRGFLDGFRAGRMRVAGAREVFRAAAEFHENTGFMDHFAGLDADNVHAEHAIGLRICENLHEAVGGLVDLGTAVGGKGKLRDGISCALPFISTPVTFEPSLNANPCFSRMRWNCLAISPSMPGRMRSRNSTTMTSEPSRRHTEPSSRPITPAPTISSLPGTLSSDSAPVDDTMRVSSISMPFSRAMSEPVAITMLLVSTTCDLPSAETSTLPVPRILPVPLSTSI